MDELIAALRAIAPPPPGRPVTVEEMNEGIADAVAEEMARSLSSEDAAPEGGRPERARPKRVRRAA